MRISGWTHSCRRELVFLLFSCSAGKQSSQSREQQQQQQRSFVPGSHFKRTRPHNEPVHWMYTQSAVYSIHPQLYKQCSISQRIEARRERCQRSVRPSVRHTFQGALTFYPATDGVLFTFTQASYISAISMVLYEKWKPHWSARWHAQNAEEEKATLFFF